MTLLTCLTHEALKTCKCVFKPAKPYICLLYWCHNTVLLSQPIHDVLITLDTKLVDIGWIKDLQYMYFLWSTTVILFVSKAMYCVTLRQNVRLRN